MTRLSATIFSKKNFLKKLKNNFTLEEERKTKDDQIKNDFEKYYLGVIEELYF